MKTLEEIKMEDKDFNPSVDSSKAQHSNGISIDKQEYDAKQNLRNFISKIISMIESENLHPSDCCGNMKNVGDYGDAFGIVKINSRKGFLGITFQDKIQIATLWIENNCRGAQRQKLWIFEVKMDYLVLCQKLAGKFYSQFGIKILLRVG